MLLHRYSRDITGIARETLGRDAVDNRAIQTMVVMNGTPGLTPSDLANTLGVSRSVVSRNVGILQGAGLVVREVSTIDRRKATLTLTARGRRRLSTFTAKLDDYFVSSAPLVKDVLTELGIELSPPEDPQGVDPLKATTRLSAAGAAYVEDVNGVLRPFGVDDLTERMALILTQDSRQVRPSQLVNELHMSSGAVSALLDRLELLDLITRKHNQVLGDRRAVVVTLTPKGRRAVRAMLGVFSEHVDELLGAIRWPLR